MSTREIRLSINPVTADKKARLNAQVWQALATSERIHTDRSVGVVHVTDDTDTIVCASWRNWQAITRYIDALEHELEQMKGENA